MATNSGQACLDSVLPRRFYYGWAMTGVATAAMIATGPGQTIVVSQFNHAFRTDLGLSQTTLGTTYMVGTLAAALPLVLVGRASDRFGPRLVMGVVAALFGLACAATGWVRGTVTLTLAFFALRFLGQGALALVSGHALALWFERRLGTANAVKMVLMQFGMAVMPGVTMALIASYGWRTAWGVLGGVVWVLVLPPVVFLARNRPCEVGQRIDGDPPVAASSAPPGTPPPADPAHPDPAFTLPQALRTVAYWIIVLPMVLNGLIGTALLFHVQPLITAAALPVELSPGVLRTWSLTVMICVLPAGHLADRLAPRPLIALSLVLLAAAALLAGEARGEPHFHAAYALSGLSQALAIGVGVPTIARYFGRAHHGAIRGSVTRLGVAGTGLGPVLLGLGFDHPAGARPVLMLMAGACVPLFVAALFLRRPPPPPPGS